MTQTYLGIQVYFNSSDIGNQGTEETAPGNHIPPKSGDKAGLINMFASSKFTEYIVEIDRNSYIESDDGEDKLFSFGEIMTPVKREIVYVEI